MSANPKIVFILGAGASQHLGYPTGNELKNWIINDFVPPNDIRWDSDKIETFRKTLKYSCEPSIDTFLEKAKNFENDDPQYYDFGRFAIAKCLIEKESTEQLTDDKNNWYHYFWSKIHNDINVLIDGSISFITFNYDVSLEYFLVNAIKYSHHGYFTTKEHDDQIYEFMRKIPLIHVYGKTGILPWEKETKFNVRLHEDKSNRKIWEASQQIHLISDEREAKDVLIKAHEFLRLTDIICFLGFGFDSINISKLNLSSVIEDVRKKYKLELFGTAYGLKDAQRKSVCNLLGTTNITLGGEKEGIEDFFKEYLDHYFV